MADLSKKFVTEDEIEEQKKQRQEEWEKVRRPDQPEEAPEETYDPRCLYDRLQEQKNKKDEEYEEAHKLKNQIRGLDEDETGFLDFVSTRQQEIQKAKMAEEEDVLNEYRNSVASKVTVVNETGKAASNSGEKKTPSRPVSKQSSQSKLLAGVVKRKSDAVDASGDSNASKKVKVDSTVVPLVTKALGDLPNKGHAVVVGKLPGLGHYVGSSSDTSDSNSDDSDIETDHYAKKHACESGCQH